MLRDSNGRGYDMQRKNLTMMDRLRVPVYDDARQMRFGDIVIDRERCRGCGICVTICPGACLVTDTATKMDIMNGKARKGSYGIPRLNVLSTGAALCLACFDCGTACPHGAIGLKGNFDPGYRFRRLTQEAVLEYPKRY